MTRQRGAAGWLAGLVPRPARRVLPVGCSWTRHGSFSWQLGKRDVRVLERARHFSMEPDGQPGGRRVEPVNVDGGCHSDPPAAKTARGWVVQLAGSRCQDKQIVLPVHAVCQKKR